MFMKNIAFFLIPALFHLTLSAFDNKGGESYSPLIDLDDAEDVLLNSHPLGLESLSFTHKSRKHMKVVLEDALTENNILRIALIYVVSKDREIARAEATVVATSVSGAIGAAVGLVFLPAGIGAAAVCAPVCGYFAYRTYSYGEIRRMAQVRLKEHLTGKAYKNIKSTTLDHSGLTNLIAVLKSEGIVVEEGPDSWDEEEWHSRGFYSQSI